MHEKYDKKDYVYFDKEKQIKIIYKTQTISKNNIYYKYQKRPKCPGRGKLCLNNEIEGNLSLFCPIIGKRILYFKLGKRDCFHKLFFITASNNAVL